MKRTPEANVAEIKNMSQPNIEESASKMKADTGTVICAGASEKQAIRKEFKRETVVAFEFDDPEDKEEEEIGALEHLEKMLFGRSMENNEDTLGRMDKLTEHFKECKFEQPSRAKDGTFSILHYVYKDGVVAFRCGKLPDRPVTKDELPQLFTNEVTSITGIKIPIDEVSICWDVRVNKHLKDYPSLHDYFLDDGLLGWDYAPKTRIPGECWRIHVSETSHEISAVLWRIITFKEGYLTAKERLTRWGIVMYVSSKIKEFQRGYSGNPEEWGRILRILDVCEEDMLTMLNFAAGMHLLDPVNDLIPIRVLGVITVFRVLFRLTLKQFELAHDASV